jgi:hypothetical protein
MADESPSVPDKGARFASWAPLPQHLAHWFPIVSVYSIVLGVVTQRAYWHSFNVDVMEYMGLEDVLRVSVVPLLLVTFGVAVVVAYWTWATWVMQARAAELQGQGQARRSFRDLSRAELIRLLIGTFLLLVLLLVLVLLLLWNSDFWILFVGSILGALFLAIVFAAPFRRIGTEPVRLVLFAIFALAPCFAWVQGYGIAQNVLSGRAVAIVTLPGGFLQGLPNVHSPVYYIGHIGEYDFFWTDNQTVVFRALPTFSYTFVQEQPPKLRIPFRDPLTH